MGQGNGRNEDHHREVREHNGQQRRRGPCAVPSSRWQQPIHHDGGAVLPVRFHDHRPPEQPPTVAVHYVLPDAAPLPRQSPELPHQEPRRLGNGPQRAGPPRGPRQRRVPPRLRHGGLLLQHPDRRPVLRLPQLQLRAPLRREPSPPGAVLPRRLAEEQPRIPGRLPVLDRRDPVHALGRLLRHDDAGHPVDPEPEDRLRIEELRTVEGEVHGRRDPALLGAPLVQAHLEGGPRGDDQPPDVRQVSEQLPVGERSDRRRFLLSQFEWFVTGSWAPSKIPRRSDSTLHRVFIFF